MTATTLIKSLLEPLLNMRDSLSKDAMSLIIARWSLMRLKYLARRGSEISTLEQMENLTPART